ncbi:CCAAT/enhancer-binding protein zeta isoform X4 [Salarias fasciatus]|uniref:CCAAT/enhancer-binding protein zeta n=1 Tax=Salarias fasciatus TaxID=181472 RepID=A0A672G217_SALFA|nr:CCAAT/enhancer-binding protein zeta isoform X4 [Salarias fasciatus]
MAAKNKQRRKGKAPTKARFQERGDEVQSENVDREEEEGLDEDGGGNNAQEDKDELDLEEVLRLGGTQADYVLLAGLDDNSELLDGGKKGAIDDLEEGELEKFITKLGIRAFASQQFISDEPEAAPSTAATAPSTAPSTAAATSSTVAAAPSTAAEAQSGKKKKDSQQAKAKTAGDQVKKSADASAASAKKAKQNVFDFHPRNVLLVKPGGKWFEAECASEGSAAAQDPALVSRYKELAQRLYEAEVQLFKTKKTLQKGANTRWMKTVVSSGVLADRMAAMTLLIQDAPVHMLEHVESLVAMVKKRGGRRMGLMAMDTVRELLLSNLLPEHRKLRPFDQRPFDQLEERASGNRDARDRRLVLWYFEHRLKHHVAEFVEALDSAAHDTVPATKAKALATAHELLCGRPEQEKALLVQVVNKLGDPEYKTAAKASYLLETLLHKHPNMKVVVCCEVERLLFRPNVSAKAQYYAVCFLSQVLLSHDEAELAAKLIAVYFSFFRACVKTKDVDSKMLSALLSGVNRAYPYAGAGDEKVKEQMDTLFRVVHLVRFNTAVQALMLLFQVMDSQQSISDRYYVTLYRKLLDPGLSSSSRQSMFLNLLYKSLKADVALRRVKAFVKRLLQVSAEQGASFACGALFLVSEVMRAKPGLKTLLQEAEDGEEEAFKDLAEENDDDDDEEERFVDADKQEEGASVEEEAAAAAVVKPAASWVHHQNLDGTKSSQSYDPLHRNPLFCGADLTTLWELQRLSLHYHPSVSLFAKTILQGGFIQYSGDPLQDFTLIRFLDRFVFRNPKQLKGKQNTDAAALMPKQRLPAKSLPVNCEEFLSKDESQIPVDEIFFHRYFKKRQQEKQKRRPQRDGDNESVEDVDDDEFEKALDEFESDSYFPSLSGDDLDFAGNVKSSKGKKKASEDSDSDDVDDSDVDNLDDEEMSLGSMEEEDFGDELEEEGGTFMDAEGGGDDDDDDEVPELEDDDDAFAESDGDEMEAPDITPRSKKQKRKSSEELDFSASFGATQGKKKKKMKDGGMLKAAEEFGSMLDENAGSKFDNIGLNAMANRDKAALKQLKWEAQRDDWIHGRDAKTLRKKKAAFNRRKTATFGRGRAAGRPLGGKKRRK